jgi:dephospho-CoA kinase
MLKVGITGGIGSGKTIVCRVFETLGIPVFYADDAARYLMEKDAALIGSIKTLFGNDIYKNGKPDREQIAAIVFSDKEKLQRLNALIHPATVRYAREWMDSKKSPYTIKEAAIFFESGTNIDMDVMVGVYAPLALRLQRAMERGNATREQILARMAQQMDEDEKMKRCDYIVTNDESQGIISQVLELHQLLLARAERQD